MIAIGAGDGSLAIRYAGQARKALPNEPLTHLLRAQTAQLTGDRATSRRIFEAMLASPDTEQLGLRGLFLEAQREGEREAARQFAERALKLNPKLAWPVEALFDLQCRADDWQGALDTLAIGAAQQPDRQDGRRPPPRRAADRTGAGGRGYGGRQGARAGAAKRIGWRRTWCRPPPSPAACWPRRATRRAPRACCSRPGASRRIPTSPPPTPTPVPATARATGSTACATSPRLTPHDSEGPIALAITAIEAREWDEARGALEPLLEGRLTQRVATLMARIEGEQHGHTGRVREWLARAVNAPRDPAWTADGVVSDRWAPVSPVTGALDAFRWRVPVEAVDAPAGALLAPRSRPWWAWAPEPSAGACGCPSRPQLPAAETVEPIDRPSAAAPARRTRRASGCRAVPAGVALLRRAAPLWRLRRRRKRRGRRVRGVTRGTPARQPPRRRRPQARNEADIPKERGAAGDQRRPKTCRTPRAGRARASRGAQDFRAAAAPGRSRPRAERGGGSRDRPFGPSPAKA